MRTIEINSAFRELGRAPGPGDSRAKEHPPVPLREPEVSAKAEPVDRDRPCRPMQVE